MMPSSLIFISQTTKACLLTYISHGVFPSIFFVFSLAPKAINLSEISSFKKAKDKCRAEFPSF